MKKIKAITNLISLILTASLLVLVTVAWYATNKTASVSQARGTVAVLPELVDQVDYYNFSAVSGTTYTVEDHATNTGTCDLQEYTYTGVKPTVYLIRIKLKTNTSISKIRFISSAKKFAGFYSRISGPDTRLDSNGVFDTDNLNVSLSSAIRFYYLGATNNPNQYVNQTDSSATFTMPTTGWKSFEYDRQGNITVSTVDMLENDTIAAENGSVYIHLLLDYDIDHLNEIFGNNLSNQDALNYGEHGPIFSDKDFTIYLLS